MPLAMGFHTTFTEPDRFSVPLGKRWEQDKRYLPTGRLMELNGKEKQITQGCLAGWRPSHGIFHRGRPQGGNRGLSNGNLRAV